MLKQSVVKVFPVSTVVGIKQGLRKNAHSAHVITHHKSCLILLKVLQGHVMIPTVAILTMIQTIMMPKVSYCEHSNQYAKSLHKMDLNVKLYEYGEVNLDSVCHKTFGTVSVSIS